MLLYFGLKDYFDYWWDNFYYFTMYNVPFEVKRLTLLLVPIQIIVFILMIIIAKKNISKIKGKSTQVFINGLPILQKSGSEQDLNLKGASYEYLELFEFFLNS